jgi:hypothetical protein
LDYSVVSKKRRVVKGPLKNLVDFNFMHKGVMVKPL